MWATINNCLIVDKSDKAIGTFILHIYFIIDQGLINCIKVLVLKTVCKDRPEKFLLIIQNYHIMAADV